jgi:IS30 family transposase
LVIGKGHGGALVTIVGRKTNFTLSAQVDDKSAKTVTASTIALLKPFEDSVLTITEDNGKNLLTIRKLQSSCNMAFILQILIVLGNED